MNKVLLAGRLPRDPETRELASGKRITTFAVTTEEYAGNGQVKANHHAVVTWDKLAAVCAQYLGKGSRVAVEGKLQTREWDETGHRHWKTEIVATAVELMSGRHARDFGSEALPEVADDDL
jgi:single-strand DNA-binding protein